MLKFYNIINLIHYYDIFGFNIKIIIFEPVIQNEHMYDNLQKYFFCNITLNIDK